MTRRALADAAGLVLVVGLTLWVCRPIVAIPLWGDDAWHVYELRDPMRAVRLLYDPAVALEVNWAWFRPLGDLSYTFDYQLWRLDPTGYHLHSVVLHGLVVVMLVCVLREWLAGRAASLRVRRVTLWLIALVFALNPIAVRTVARPNMRYDLYATFLILVSLWALSRWQRGVWGGGRALACGAAFGAFASKESAVVLLPLVFLLSTGTMRRRLRILLPFAATCLLYLVWRALVIHAGFGGYFWLEWSWRDFFRPASYLMLATAMARFAWGTAWALGALLLGALVLPKLGVVTSLAFVATLVPLVLLGSEASTGVYRFYLSLAMFALALGAAVAGLERWKAGWVASLLCLLGLVGMGLQRVEGVLVAEARLGEDRRAEAASLARVPPPPPGVTDYFLAEGDFPHVYLSRTTGLLTDTLQERWHVLDLGAALVSPSLAEKAATGAARLFRYDGTAWNDTTAQSVSEIRSKLAGPKPPPPSLMVTAHGYRMTVRVAAGTHIGLFRLYFNRTGEPGIYAGSVGIPVGDTTFSIPGGTYVITATYATHQGESAQAPEVQVTIPAVRAR